ncbi:Pimeloyl-ACP methyl ester carboxylesterase [Cnuella takakiae]|uniref:Pimeloyl-ACP methyl ester carboxylesterase n=1 Tax=Cnuella takakiae TaxID=1302690 RepID=A0A1M5B5M6_9BACT|nr:alpha/beta hydrolase [Cnuella takakiae]OLY93346.1 alpha/beta hydrolase [Cnuella takakiae]SHF37740.1 Pimeloyl-ACP methyl ester carboxylesterase [Cnuella takakiae]
MKFIKLKDAASGEEVQISYKDYGQGRPVVLIHGWPLSKDMWEYQIDDLVNAGLRVVKYDRRGFGKSDKPWDGYDYDTLTEDLHALLEQLDLRDAVLVGFSMGGGEAVRYISRYGTDRVSGLVLVSAVTPYMLKTADNPDGVDESVFAEMMTEMKKDRIGFLDDFGKKFFGVSLINHPVSTPLLEYYRSLASVALPRATQQCAIAFAQTDFRNDIQNIKVPTLIIHGDADKTVPIEASSNRTAQMIAGAEYIVYEDAPHGLFYTHRERLNADLIGFCSKHATTAAASTQQRISG